MLAAFYADIMNGKKNPNKPTGFFYNIFNMHAFTCSFIILVFLKIENNKEILMRLGVVDPLVDLLNSKNVEVQCNTCGCITALATTGKH